MKLVGFHRILAASPIWLTTAVLALATEGAIYILRTWYEGLLYQVSFSAEFGDLGLLIAILIGATVLREKNVRDWRYSPKSNWLYNSRTQFALLTLCFGIAIVADIATFGSRSGHPGDRYHDLVIVPFILFSAVTVLPIIWRNAYRYEKAAIVLAVVVWASLVYVDVANDRMNQRQWLVHHGFAIKGEIPRY